MPKRLDLWLHENIFNGLLYPLRKAGYKGNAIKLRENDMTICEIDINITNKCNLRGRTGLYDRL